MRTVTIPALCGLALAIMAGASTSHYFSVKKIVHLAGNSQSGSSSGLGGSDDAIDQTTLALREIDRQNASLRDTLARNKAALAKSMPAMGGNLPEPQSNDPDLKRLLAELVAQNRILHDQIAETNRDMMEMQFRLDTHSEQFRPLKVSDPDRPLTTYPDSGFHDEEIGVLPPLDLP